MTLDSYRLAAHAHIGAANRILAPHVQEDGAPVIPEPALTPGSGAYLAHVALECAIKARILYRGGFADAEALRKKLPKVYSALFTSAKGHDLQLLAKELRLPDFVKTLGKAWYDDACWRRMCGAGLRPYSLRYGTERVTRATAAEDVARTRLLLEVLLSGIKRSKTK